MSDPMILMGQKGNALTPFPCPVYVQKRTENSGIVEYSIMCGDRAMAKYKELAPAKMEIQRLAEVWKSRDLTQPCVFQFVKDVK